MPKKPKTTKLTLHKETVRQLAETLLGDVGGGLGVKPIAAVFSESATRRWPSSNHNNPHRSMRA